MIFCRPEFGNGLVNKRWCFQEGHETFARAKADPTGRITGIPEGIAELKAPNKVADHGYGDGKINLGFNAGAAIGIGGKLEGNVEIDLNKAAKLAEKFSGNQPESPEAREAVESVRGPIADRIQDIGKRLGLQISKLQEEYRTNPTAQLIVVALLQNPPVKAYAEQTGKDALKKDAEGNRTQLLQAIERITQSA
ncbi:MAG: hypothetical protein Q8O95_05310 [bacterium]|nr:hypothetical protein [bacterium]